MFGGKQHQFPIFTLEKANKNKIRNNLRILAQFLR